MANVSAPRGFQLSKTANEVRRRVRTVDSSNSLAIAPGDAYTIEADGNVTRANSGSVKVNGIMDAVVLKAKSGEGPESLDYVPVSTECEIIGIEDADVEFEVEIDTVALADLDTNKLIDLADTAPSAVLRESRQTVAVADGDQFSLVGLVPRIGNEYGANAKVLVRIVALNIV